MNNINTPLLLQRFTYLLILLSLTIFVGCSSPAAESDAHDHAHDGHGHSEDTHDEHAHADEHAHTHSAEAIILDLPTLSAAELNGAALQVVATTSIIGDVLAQVGGDAIDLTTLMDLGQDPHGYQPAARDLTQVASADVVFINGWDLEEGLVDDLENIAGGVPVVAISAEIDPLAINDAADPHVWLEIDNVAQWVRNAESILSALDPASAETYGANAAAYQVELSELKAYADAELAQVSDNKRNLITNHDALSYFANHYGFTILGTVIPTNSTVAEPSASDLADLIALMEAHTVCTIFTETTVSEALAETVSAELSTCDSVQLQPLYTGAIGPVGSGADSYIGMMRSNIDSIVDGLK